MTVRALELFCGIGGFAAAVSGSGVQIVGALDQDNAALDIYRLNFPGHDAQRRDLEKIGVDELADFNAGLWWLSPPCQPYCMRGARRDLGDPRARSLLRLIDILAAFSDNLRPLHLALENVEGFARSQARGRLLTLLESRGYLVHERLLCPTELGVPSRRPRYYLTASRFLFKPPVATNVPGLRPLADYLETFPSNETLQALSLPGPFLARFGKGLRILDPDNPAAYTTCFTSSYGKSIMCSGSYLRRGDGARYFAPEEVARLLHLPAGFLFPEVESLGENGIILATVCR